LDNSPVLSDLRSSFVHAHSLEYLLFKLFSIHHIWARAYRREYIGNILKSAFFWASEAKSCLTVKQIKVNFGVYMPQLLQVRFRME
jgi:hypothetical protein